MLENLWNSGLRDFCQSNAENVLSPTISTTYQTSFSLVETSTLSNSLHPSSGHTSTTSMYPDRIVIDNLPPEYSSAPISASDLKKMLDQSNKIAKKYAQF